MVNRIFTTIFVCWFSFFCMADDVDALNEIRAAQAHAYGSVYSKLEDKAQLILKQNEATSDRAWWHHAIHLISRFTYQLLFIVAVWFLIYTWWYCSAYYIVLGIVLSIITGFLLSLSYYESRLSWGIIKASPASVYIGPDTRYPLCGTLGFLTEVPVHKTHNDWIFVGGRIRGWISSQDIGYRE